MKAPQQRGGFRRRHRHGAKDETKGVEMWSHACYESPPGVKRLYQHDYYADKAADGTVLGVSCIVQDITQ